MMAGYLVVSRVDKWTLGRVERVRKRAGAKEMEKGADELAIRLTHTRIPSRRGTRRSTVGECGPFQQHESHCSSVQNPSKLLLGFKKSNGQRRGERQ